jgi:PAS domain S-box-containing protein
MRGRLTLRERLLAVLVAALVPFIAACVWLAVEQNRAALGLAHSQLKFAASLLAANQDRAADSARQLLGAIATAAELRAGGRARCQPYFESLRAQFPMYTNMGVLAPDGHVVCHALGARGDAGAQDRDYFRQAVARREFVMGEPIVGRITGKPSVPFAMPVIENGEVAAVVFATLDLASVSDSLQPLELPEAARVLVADRHGRVLMEKPPQPNKPVLRNATDRVLLDAARTATTTTGEGVDAQGDARLFAIASSRRIGDEGFVVRVGMSRAAVLRTAWVQAHDAFFGLALLMLSALVSVWWIGGRLIVSPAKQILGAVRRLEKGRLDARVSLQGGSTRGEFARIAAAFNLLAQSLQLRQADVEAELGRSRNAYAVLDQVLNSMQEGVIAVTANGRFLMYNETATRFFPLKDAPVLPALWPEHFGLHRIEDRTLYAADELPLVRSALGESGSHLSFVRNAVVPEGRVLQCRWQPLHGDAASGGLVVFSDVTEIQRLQAEQSAQFAQLEETQRKLIESQRIGRVGNWELDLRTGRLWWSDEVFDLYGIERDEFDGTLAGFEQRVLPEDRGLLKPARDQALRDGRTMALEYRVVKPDGSIAWMHEIAETRRDAQGEPIWFGGVVQDITLRKRQEEELQASQRALQAYTQMLQRAAESAQAITGQSTLEGTLEEVVRQACLVLEANHASISVDAGEARIAREFHRPGAAAATGTEDLAVTIADRGGRHAGELRVQGRQGGAYTQRDRYVAMELAHLASIAIENARLFAEVRELNAGLESRIAERTAELDRQQQLYRKLAEQAPEVVWQTDAHGHVSYLNRAWYDLVGGAPPEGLGQQWFERVHPEDRREVHDNWLRARQMLQPYVGTRRFLSRDGSYHTMSYKAAPILDAGGEVNSWIGIDADITQFKAIESALRSSNQELEAFSYSVSHDLRAPLGAIAGFARALEGKVNALGDEKALHYLARIEAGVAKMEQLIDSLLKLSRVVRAPLEWQAVDLSALAHEALDNLQAQDPTRRVAVHVEERLTVHGDVRLLRIALENLLGNAWKFTSQTPDAAIAVGRLQDDVIFVRDNGVGFDMAYADKLFTAFQRLHTETEFPGTGIGLATVRRVVARHQGRVWVESEPGRGTAFYFSLSPVIPPAWLLSQSAAPG